MQVAHKTINQTGLAEIHAFLAARHKLGGDHFTPAMLSAWADDAEFQLSEGNSATIEIRSWDTVSGHTEEFTVSGAGIDTTMIEVDTGDVVAAKREPRNPSQSAFRTPWL